MSPEAFAGWVLGFLDGAGDELTPNQIAFLRDRAESVAAGGRDVARPTTPPPTPAEAKPLADRVAEIQANAKNVKKAPRRPPPDPAALAGLPEVVSLG